MQIRDLLQGKLPFAGVEWLGSGEDLTDDEKQTSDSNLLVQDETFSKAPSGEDTTTSENDAIASDDKPLTPIDNKVTDNKPTSSSDDSSTSFEVVSSHMNREELMKAVFEDNSGSDNTKQAGLISTQNNIFSDSHYDPDDWVDIPNDDLI